MHYNGQKVGFLDKLKNNEIDAFERQFAYELVDDHLHFYPSEIDVLIGAGGVFSHSPSPKHSAAILIDGFDAHGITDLWLDKDFITPHLGVLATLEPALSTQLLETACIQKLATHIRPHFHGNPHKPVLQINYSENGSHKELTLMPETVVFLEKALPRELQITPLGKCVIGIDNKPLTITSELPIIIDTRSSVVNSAAILEKALGLSQNIPAEELSRQAFVNQAIAIQGEFYKVINLPYKGDILVSVNDTVSPDMVVAINKFNPPRLFIVNAYTNVENITPQLVESTLQVSLGDKVNFNTVLRHLPEPPKKRYVGQEFKSPVRGKVEFIDYHSGTLVMSEIQDYDDKPTHVKVAELLSLPPKKARSLVKHQVGDFIYQGDTLAAKIDDNPSFVVSPTSGVITEIDSATCTVTIQYKLMPHSYLAHVKGTVTEVRDFNSLSIIYSGLKIEAKLGLGKRCHGEFLYITDPTTLDSAVFANKVVAVDFAPDAKMLETLKKNRAVAIVCPGLKQADLVQVLEKEIGVISTGNEEIPLTIIITDAFGTQHFGSSFKALFTRHNGTMCHIEPHTRIRAGVARPYLCFM